MLDHIVLVTLLAAGVVLFTRLVAFNARHADRRLNVALALASFGVALRHTQLVDVLHELEPGLTPGRLYLASEVAIIGFAAVLVVVGYKWVFRRGPYYVVPGMYAVAAMLMTLEVTVGLSAHAHNEVPNLHAGWAAVAYSSPPRMAVTALIMHDALSYGFAVAILILSIREYRRRRRHPLVCFGIAAIALSAALDTTVSSVAMAYAIAGVHTSWIDGLANEDPFGPHVQLAVYCALVAIPIGKAVLHRLRVDRSSRLRRRLTPLWADLTAAFPETVFGMAFAATERHSHFRLHRIVVEIRDCMLLLSAEPREGPSTLNTRASTELGAALRLAAASAVSARGRSTRLGKLDKRQATDLICDAKELCRLVEHWPAAKSRAAALVNCHAAG